MAPAALFPEAPIGTGVDHFLALFNQSVISSAQPIVSLSPFIIPLLIAAALTVHRWLGPVAAALLVLPCLGALFNAEQVLQTRAMLPPPSELLSAKKQGTTVRADRSPGRAVPLDVNVAAVAGG